MKTEGRTSRTQGIAQLRNFGLLVGGIFGVIGLWPLVWRQQTPRSWALVIAVFLVLPALVAPRVLSPVYRFWMALGEVLAWINTRIILGVVFYGVVTPIAVAMRLRGRDALKLRRRECDSYWQDLPPPPPPERYERQF